jgi:hypothetical protein
VPGYEDVEQRPVLSQLLSDAGAKFQVVMCARSGFWSHDVALAYRSLAHLRRLQVWWATADELWETNKVERDGLQVICHIESRRPTRRVARIILHRPELANAVRYAALAQVQKFEG